MNSSFKKEIELKIEDIEKETKKNKFLPGACVLENLRKRKNVRRIQELKENVDKIYLKIKVCRKNRNRVREIIDLKEMEIDDLQFEIDKMKSISKLRVWNY